MFGHNLATDDPVLAARYMTATAGLSRRTKNACYHASINWHPDEQPAPEIMREIARKTLEMAGLGEHQALVMGHGDKPHRHLHLMINRVHPETGRAWSTSHDYRRFDRIMKQLADEYGFRHVPPHSFHPELTDELPKAPDSNATYAARKGAATRRPQWSAVRSRAYGAGLSEALDRASSWEDIEAALAEDGFTLEAKGTGLVVGDAGSNTKFSALGLTLTAKALAERFGRAFKPSRDRLPSVSPASPLPSLPLRRSPPLPMVQDWTNGRNVWTVDAIDIARAIGSNEDVQHAVRDALRERKARLAGKPLMDQLMEELREELRASTTMQAPGARRFFKVQRCRKHQRLRPGRE